MSKAQHTPVKWRAFDAEGNVIIECIGNRAAMRTAAPDLLAALEALQKANGANNFDGWHPSFDDAIAKARAAIAKAKGE